MAEDAIRDATGMHARNAPLSEAVVLDIPTVSNIKYITGSRSAIKSSGFIFLPLRSIFTTPAAAHALSTIKATTNLHPRSAGTLALSVAFFVKI